ncbi:GTPase family protein [Thermodesulforhabdus norvegica]|uniref:50S ribosome-binding GTPase n=1 Tax=Thermodesulforhabdus norvegica TaxID=39841 RepID=A0A1I4QVG7_9BACT|nr:GTPase [Thermodesulforhabdus norvegica]SFM43700.1 50S ribosome-binding GTPase [Thermodesulforhabdus norvegica]
MGARLDLEKDIEKAERLLEGLPSWALDERERSELERGLQRVKGDLEKLSEQGLVIGILGGTGVGKSTVMNALAGEEISRVSHRRPYTDRVIIYHHLNTPFPKGFPPGDVPSVVFSHEAQGAERLILCDLPDFDSIREEHRDRVLSFLRNLDILVWITSPEKYADQAFYDFLKEAVRYKSPENYFFILNKVDLIASEDYRSIDAAVKTFEKYLSERGIPRPVIFAVSALEAFESREFSPWNQWELFRREVLRERELKEVREIKKANIHQEMSYLIEKLELGKKQIERVALVIDEMNGLVEELHDESREKFTKVILQWLALCVAPQVREIMEAQPNLIGPARLVHGVISLMGGKRKTGDLKNCDEEIISTLSPVFRRIENRMMAFAVSRGIPPSVMAALEDLWSEKNLAEMFGQSMNFWKESSIRTDSLKMGSLFFRLYQRFVYLGLLLLFVASVGEIWAVQDTGITGRIMTLLVNFFSKMFSLDGLGAVLVFIIFELMAGAYFCSRYRKSLQARVEKFIEALSEDAAALCDEFFLAIRKMIENKRREIFPTSERDPR